MLSDQFWSFMMSHNPIFMFFCLSFSTLNLNQARFKPHNGEIVMCYSFFLILMLILALQCENGSTTGSKDDFFVFHYIHGWIYNIINVKEIIIFILWIKSVCFMFSVYWKCKITTYWILYMECCHRTISRLILQALNITKHHMWSIYNIYHVL